MSKLLTSANKLNHSFWLKVVNSTSVSIESVSIFRIITGFFILLFNGNSFSWLGDAPRAFFDPPLLSLSIFFTRFPPKAFFSTIEVILLVCTLFITLGIRARLSTLVYVVLSIIAYSFQYSLGKIDHNFLFLALLICMSFSGWGSKLALVPDTLRKSDSPAKSLSLLSILVCFAFFSAGFAKGVKWMNVDFSKSGSAHWFYSGYYVMGRTYMLAPLVKNVPFFFFKLMDYAGVIFELSPLLCLLISRKSWHVWLLVACIFHLLNLLVLNIPFFINSVIYLAFFDYSGLFEKIKGKKPLLIIYCIAGLLFAIRSYYLFSFKSSSILFIEDDNLKSLLWLYLTGWVIVFVVIFSLTSGKKDSYKEEINT